MKKRLAVLLTCLLCLLAGVPSSAEEALFSSTQDFLTMLDRAGMHYTNHGLDDEGDEHVSMAMDSGEPACRIDYFFESDREHTAIFVWNLIKFDEAHATQVMQVCNDLNARYQFTCFYVEETDNTVTCSMNLIYRDDHVGMVVTEATLYLQQILEAAYPSLAAWAG